MKRPNNICPHPGCFCGGCAECTMGGCKSCRYVTGGNNNEMCFNKMNAINFVVCALLILLLLCILYIIFMKKDAKKIAQCRVPVLISTL